jgi:hypothetical protein
MYFFSLWKNGFELSDGFVKVFVAFLSHLQFLMNFPKHIQHVYFIFSLFSFCFCFCFFVLCFVCVFSPIFSIMIFFCFILFVSFVYVP